LLQPLAVESKYTLFRSEVIEVCRSAIPGTLGDFFHGGIFEALFPEQFHCCIE
jgi:hypothetical protein